MHYSNKQKSSVGFLSKNVTLTTLPSEFKVSLTKTYYSPYVLERVCYLCVLVSSR